MDERVLVYKKPIFYNKKVLVGSWVEKNSRYVKQNYKHETNYKNDFKPKAFERDVHAQWRNRVTGSGLEALIFFPCSGKDYRHNFSTTYDLSYNHLPKKLGYKQYKHKEQPQCLLTEFGNITKFGLLDYKKWEWGEDASDPRRTPTTHLNDAFPEYSTEQITKTQREMFQPRKKEICNPLTWECKTICVIKHK